MNTIAEIIVMSFAPCYVQLINDLPGYTCRVNDPKRNILPLSNDENRRSLSCFYQRLFEKYPLLFYFEMDNS